LILFDGTSLAAWSQSGPGGFRLIDGVMQSYGGMGLLSYPERTFGDFVLDLDWRITAVTDNSGVFLRFPDPGDDPSVAVNSGVWNTSRAQIICTHVVPLLERVLITMSP
jgi:hypothetical protein